MARRSDKPPATPVEDVSSEHGPGAWRYSDDSVRIRANGHMVKRLAGANVITSETARAYADIGRNKVQEAIQAALVEAGDANGIRGATPAAILAAGARILFDQAVINGQRTTIRDGDSVLTTGESAGDRLKVWKELGGQAGLLVPEEPAAQTIRHEYAFTPEIATLLGDLQRRQEQLAREGQWLEAETTDATAAQLTDAGSGAGDSGPHAQVDEAKE